MYMSGMLVARRTDMWTRIESQTHLTPKYSDKNTL